MIDSSVDTEELQERLNDIEIETGRIRRQLQQRIEELEVEAIVIRKEIERRNDEEVLSLKRQLRQLKLQGSFFETKKAETTTPNDSKPDQTLKATILSKQRLAIGANTLLSDYNNRPIFAGDRIRLRTPSTRGSPFCQDKEAIVVGTSHYGIRIWVGRVININTTTVRDPGNIVKIQNYN